MASLSESPHAQKPKETPKERAKRLGQEIDGRLDTLASAVDAVRASELFTQYLAIQARFHHYSWRNTVLIAMQRPDATQVAGFRAWQKLGRHVCKGERGIMIFAPCPFTKEKPDGETESGMFFRAVHVFDVSQTDGPDLPSVDVPTIEAQADALLADLSSVADARSIEVEFQPLSGGMFGVSKGGSVEINNTHSSGQQAKTLAHELAHEALHKSDRTGLTRSIAELEAESVAYVVCMHFGLDVEVRASRYIALWDGDSKALKESLQRIGDTARDIIDEVEALRNRKAVA